LLVQKKYGEMGLKLGLDASHDTRETLEYVVMSAASDYKTGSYALQGKYFGQKAGASLGVGAVAEVFIGGFDKSFTLQPLAVGTTEGYGVELAQLFANDYQTPLKRIKLKF
jgi:hypothetical protein